MDVDTEGVNLDTVGVILLIAGAGRAGALADLLVDVGGFGGWRRSDVVERELPPAERYRERTIDRY